jgi:transcription termination/antitermination protein NusG
MTDEIREDFAQEIADATEETLEVIDAPETADGETVEDFELAAEEEAVHVVDEAEVVAEAAPAAAESDDPYEQFFADFKAQPGKWYIIHSYAGYEKRVKQNIENRKLTVEGGDDVHQIEVPLEDTVEIKNGQRKLVTWLCACSHGHDRRIMGPHSPHPSRNRLRWQLDEPKPTSPKRGIRNAEEVAIRTS